MEVREESEGGESKKERRLDGVKTRGERIGGRWWALVGAGEGFPEKPEECHQVTTASKRRRGGDWCGR